MEIQCTNTLPRVEPESVPVVLFMEPMENRPSFREVFEMEESSLLRFACGLVKQRETAEDLVQEAFLRLHGHWEEVANPRAWLFRAVRNLALNHLRDHRRETVMDDVGEREGNSEDPEKVLGRMEAVGSLRLLVTELKAEERELIGLKYHEGLKYEQIGERMGMSVGNVGYKLHHLLKGLAEGLRRMGIENGEG